MTIVWLSAIAILVMRRFELIKAPAVWAEDVDVFFRQAHEMGFASIWHSHTGYFHLVPRSIAWLATWLPLEWTPYVYIYTTLLVWAAIAAFILTSRLPVNRLIKSLMVLSIVLVPHGGEIWINLKNIQWIVALTLLAIILEETSIPRNRKVLNGVVWTVAALTGPFVLLFLPAILLRGWYARKNRYVTILTGIACMCAALHLTSYVTSDRSAWKIWNSNIYLWAQTGYAILSGFFNVDPDQRSMVIPVVMGWLVTVTVLIRGFWKVERSDKLNVTLLIGCASIIFAITFYEFRDTLFIRPLGVANASGGPRYSFIPFVLLMWTLLLLANQRRKLISVPMALCLVVMASTLVGGHFVSITPYDPASLEKLHDLSGRPATTSQLGTLGFAPR